MEYAAYPLQWHVATHRRAASRLIQATRAYVFLKSKTTDWYARTYAHARTRTHARTHGSLLVRTARRDEPYRVHLDQTTHFAVRAFTTASGIRIDNALTDEHAADFKAFDSEMKAPPNACTRTRMHTLTRARTQMPQTTTHSALVIPLLPHVVSTSTGTCFFSPRLVFLRPAPGFALMIATLQSQPSGLTMAPKLSCPVTWYDGIMVLWLWRLCPMP